jgi:hypothetical protein
MTDEAMPCLCGCKPKFEHGVQTLADYPLFGCIQCDKFIDTFFEKNHIKAWNEACLEEKEEFIEGECHEITETKLLGDMNNEL